MKYDPNIHHRQSIRLKHFDYRQDGFYFITLCCKDNAHFFGEIIDDHMQLNEIGKIAQKCWYDIPNHFENVELHEFVIMPNHIHFIIEIVDTIRHNKFYFINVSKLNAVCFCNTACAMVTNFRIKAVIITIFGLPHSSNRSTNERYTLFL